MSFKDFINGIWSGIPICCTLSYSKGRHGLVVIDELKAEHNTSWRKAANLFYSSPCEYIQCKKCEASGKIVKIRKNGVLF